MILTTPIPYLYYTITHLFRIIISYNTILHYISFNMPRKSSESSVMRTSGRKLKPSLKALENTQLQSILDTDIASSFSAPLQASTLPLPTKNSVSPQLPIVYIAAPRSTPQEHISTPLQPTSVHIASPYSAPPEHVSTLLQPTLPLDPKTEPESIDNDSLTQSQNNTSILEAHCTPSNVSHKAIKKRPFADVLADILLLESVIFEPLETGPDREPQLRLPNNIDIDDPYALFSLYWPENLWQIISCNTNLYTVKERIGKPLSNSSRPWQDISAIEIRVFIGILIYIGIHDSKRTDLYWKNDIESGPVHISQLYISLIRFEQIKRYLHISQLLGDNIVEPSDPESASQIPDEYIEKMWWYKVLLLADIFRDACQRYYVPGSNTAIDELMIRCFGRSTHTYKMPNKPIHQEYKLFAIAEHGYIWNFIWSSRRYSFKAEIILRPELTATGSMVYHLVKCLPKLSKVYLDNYFTSIPLFRLLRKEGYGLCGTTRPFSGGSEFPTLLKEIKQFHTNSMQFHQLIAIAVPDVLCFAWQDNNIVLAMSTIHTIHTSQDFVEKVRRRPTKTSTNGAIAWKAFGDNPCLAMPIPRIFDDYNKYMGGVDIANQLRESYETHRKTFRVWFPLLYWLIDAIIINAYRLQYLYKKSKGVPTKELPTQIGFRQALYKRLFSFYISKEPLQSRSKRKFSDLPMARTNSTVQHIAIRQLKQADCIWCRYQLYQSEDST